MHARHVLVPALGLALAWPGAAAAAQEPVAGAAAKERAAKKAKTLRPVAFRSCRALTSYARARALDIAGPGGLPTRFTMPSAPVGLPVPMPAPAPEAARGDAPAAAPTPGVAAPTSATGTNVQEAGVDEPDVVKADRGRLYVIAGGRLSVLAADAAGPRLLGQLDLDGHGHELLVAGDKVLVLANGSRDAAQLRRTTSIAPGAYQPMATLTEVDVRDPAAPRVLRSMVAEGAYLSARQHGSVARVVVTTPPEPVAVPAIGAPQTPEQFAAAQRRAIRRTTVQTWRPSALLKRANGRTERRALLSCRQVRRAQAFAGLGTLTVLTIDLERGLPAVDADGLLTDAQTVYAADRSLYVGTERWVDPTTAGPAPGGRQTTVHRFELSGKDTTYRASGAVRGYLLNQFSLSEHEGVLRVATTEQPPWTPAGAQGESESAVTVLRESGGALREVGRAGGLGKGERIYAVRFLGDVGYVVTFRQTDPLYTVDLADPERPRVAGELKIPGYSAYLHPAGEDRLIGVGQDATDQGRTTGVQVSLFDVSDPASPRRLAQHGFGLNSFTEVEHDHHAFLFDPASKLAVLPVARYDGKMEHFAAGLRIGAETVAEAARLAHPDGGQIRRSLLVGDKLYTFAATGVKAHRIGDLAEAGYAELPLPTPREPYPMPDGPVASPAIPAPPPPR